MHAQRNNLKLVTIISFCLAAICMITAIFKYTLLLTIIAAYLIVISLITDGLFLQITFQRNKSIAQLARGILLFLIITFLVILHFRS